MVDTSGTVKLLDLGLSKSTRESINITATGVVLGSPYYMSPEVAKMLEAQGHPGDAEPAVMQN